MTTPLPPQPPPQGQQPPPQQPQDDGLDDAALAVAIAAFLAGLAVTASYAASIAVLLAALKVRFRLTSAALQSLGAVLTLVTEHPPAATGIIGAASAQTSRMNAARRAQYVIAASKRVLGAAREARAKGEPIGDAVQAQIERERRFYQMHQKAMWDRATAAGKIDMEAATHGDLLGWYAKHDKRTTAECKAADKHNFYVSRPPDIGLPGIGPHGGLPLRARAAVARREAAARKRAEIREGCLMRVYFDTEFLEDGRTIELISIGMVAEDGREYYAVNRDMPVRRIRRNPWLMENVVPSLPKAPGDARLYQPRRWLFNYASPHVKRRQVIAREVRDFILGTDPDMLPYVELWADWGAYDHVALCQLWGRMIDLPEGIPMWTHDLRQELERSGREKQVPSMPGARSHNALDDAREVKFRYEWLAGQRTAAGLNVEVRP